VAPEIVAALITGGVTLAGVAIGAYGRSRTKTRKRQDEVHAEQAIKALLNGEWDLRAFDTIKRHVALEDDELRQLLTRVGAVRFHKDRGGPRETEMWGLRERNLQRLRGQAHGDAGV
jgi:hypothetical protein